jgi:hypothetical protein
MINGQSCWGIFPLLLDLSITRPSATVLVLSLLLFNPQVSRRRCPHTQRGHREERVEKNEGQSDDRSRVTHRGLAGAPQPEPFSDTSHYRYFVNGERNYSFRISLWINRSIGPSR